MSADRESAYDARLSAVGSQLIERLLAEGIRPDAEPLQIEDIESFVVLEESAMFRRAIIIELMLCLRHRLAEKKSAQ
jgi:hypothetical protein